EPERVVEPALLRVELVRVSEVPLPDPPGDVPRGLQPVGNGGFGERKPDVRTGAVKLVAEPRLIAPGEQSGARRRAVRPGNVPAGEPRAGLRQRVEVRRRDVLAPLYPDVRVAHVVGDDEYDIRHLRDRLLLL